MRFRIISAFVLSILKISFSSLFVVMNSRLMCSFSQISFVASEMLAYDSVCLSSWSPVSKHQILWVS